MSVHRSRGSIALLAGVLIPIGVGMRSPASAAPEKGAVSRHFPDSIPNLSRAVRAGRVMSFQVYHLDKLGKC